MAFLCRTIVTILVLYTVINPAYSELHQKVREAKKPCGKLLKVPTETMDLYQRSMYPEGQGTYCFLRCIGIVTGFWDDGKGLVPGVLYGLDSMGKTKPDFDEIVDGCQEIEGTEQDDCLKAFEAIMCMRKHYYEAWNLPMPKKKNKKLN